MTIKEIAVELERGKPKLNWEAEFGAEIESLKAGDTSVSPNLAKIYERLFLFEYVKEAGKCIYLLRGERTDPSRLRGLTPELVPIVGRATELEQLEELIEQVAEDQGQIVDIVGDAGIGKTRLLAEFKESLTRRQTRYVEGSFSPHRATPYEGFRQVVVGLVGPGIQTLSRWEMTDAETDFLRVFLEPNAKIDRLVGMKEEEIRQGLFFAVRKLLRGAARTPLVIIFEDLHWADPHSINLMEYILDGLETTRLLLVLLHRPDLEPRWTKKLNYTEIRPAPLREDEIDRFAGTLLGVDRVALQLRRDLQRLSLGNPLYVEEVIRQQKESNSFAIETDAEGFRYAKPIGSLNAEMPTTLHALIASRFDKLPESHREVLQWLSLFGSSFEADEATVFLDSKQTQDLSAVMKELFHRNYLAEKSAFPKRIQRFTHDLIFEVIHESVSLEARQRRHTEIGEFLLKRHGTASSEALDRIAHHFIAGIPSPEAIKTILEAGRQATEFHRFLKAHQFFSAATTMWELLRLTVPSADEVFEPLVRSTIMVGDLGEVSQLFERWTFAGIGSNHESRGRFARLELMFFNLKADSEKALEASERALHEFQADPALEEHVIEMMHDRVQALLNGGRNRDAIHETLRALKRFEGEKYRTAQIRLWARVAFSITTTGNPEHALEYLRRAQSLIRPETPAPVQVEVMLRFGPTLERLGRGREAIGILSRAIEIAGEAGLRQLAARCRMNHGVHALEAGDYELALADARQVILEAREIRDRSTETFACVNYFDNLIDLGAAEAANRFWVEHSETLSHSDDRWADASVQGTRGSLSYLTGKYMDAAARYREAAAIRRTIGHHSGAGRALMNALQIEAEGKLRPINEITREFDSLASATQGTRWLDHQFILHGIAMALAALGGHPIHGLTPELQPRDCPIAWLRQLCYVARIKWLDSLKKCKEADELRDEYGKERERIAQNVPKEYLNDFMNHPLYKVPERAK
ncbi:MAG: AAA family ATPase [Pseudomonadota bacterium]